MLTANLYATFRLIAGEKTVCVDWSPGITLRQAVQRILKKSPSLRAHWVDKFGELYPHVHIFINGVDFATLPGGEDTALSPGDSLDFFPPVAGG